MEYDRYYLESDAACGEAFPEFVEFAEAHGGAGVHVLDMGCGQGRDALVFGRQGCRVLGIDISSIGVSQMNAVAAAEKLHVKGVMEDVCGYEPSRAYDIIILDRILHMLDSDEERQDVLDVVTEATKPGGFVLVADGPKHRAQIRGHFQSLGWGFDKDTRNRIFVQRPA